MSEAMDNRSQDLVDLDYTNKVQHEFESVYERIAETLSVDNFAGYLDILKSNGVIIKPEAVVALYKTRLIDALRKSFEQMWNSQSVPQNLLILEFLKNKYKNRTQPQWRPFGLSAKDQVLPLQVRMLLKKVEYLTKLLEFQKEQLESVVPQVEERRKAFEQIVKRREMLSFQIDTKTEILPVVSDEITELLVKAVDQW